VGHEAEACTNCKTTGAVLPGRFNNTHVYCCYKKRAEKQKREKGKEEICVLSHKELCIPLTYCGDYLSEKQGWQARGLTVTLSPFKPTTYCT
jgi:hypothetical protein